MIQQTSLMAFETVNLPQSQMKVLSAIKVLNNQNVFPCDKEIAEFLRIEINKVTPRRLELYKQGLIQYKGIKTYKGYNVRCWYE